MTPPGSRRRTAVATLDRPEAATSCCPHFHDAVEGIRRCRSIGIGRLGIVDEQHVADGADFERARTEWLRSLGIAQRELRERTGGIFVVGETSVRYLRPARLDDELLVTARVQTAGRASLVLAQEAFLLDSKMLLCEGIIRIGWVEAASLKPARIPPNLLEAIQQ